MPEESPYIVGRATGGNLELENLLRSVLKCYCFESVRSDKVMGNKIYIWVSIYLHFNYTAVYSILPTTCPSCMCESQREFSTELE